MNVFDAIVLGVIEGLTEFLPVSSTGHLILTSYLLGIPDTAFLKSFEIAIQFGAICAVIFLYWRLFLNVEVLKRLGAAFVPTAVIGFLLYTFIKTYLIGNEYEVLLALALGGVALIAFEMLQVRRGGAAGATSSSMAQSLPPTPIEEDATPAARMENITHVSYAQAFGVGLFQSVAMIPGVSRSGATIIGGLLLGFKRTTIVEFSFLLAVPTMLAATVFDIAKNYTVFSGTDVTALAVGFITAFLVALAAIRFFLQFIQTHTFITFGIYRIALAAVFFLVFI